MRVQTHHKILFVVVILLLLGVAPAGAQSSPPDGYRDLPDIPVFRDTPYGQWAGSGNGFTLETVGGDGNPGLPVDEAVRFNDLPSYRIAVSGENGWWATILAGNDWEAYSLEPYVPDGFLEFNVRSAGAPVNFSVSINDIDNTRVPLNQESQRVNITDFVRVSSEWQAVKIPLRSLFGSQSNLNLTQISNLAIAGVDFTPTRFWLNDIRFSSEASEPGYPAIKLNQVGYMPAAVKQALITGFAEELTATVGTPFEIREISSNELVYSGELTLVSEFEAIISGEKMLEADFTTLTTPGDYYLTISAFQFDDAVPFLIGSEIYQPILRDSIRYFYMQRSGIALEATYAGDFARDIGHPQDRVAQFRSGADGTRDVSGGWYDAGDYGKYSNAGAVAISDLLWAFEMFPDQFADNQLNIPESGNGVPDLLDEVRWELEWLLKMQDPATGGFYHMVQPTEDVTPDNAEGVRYIEDVRGGQGGIQPTSSSGSSVAALAHAALVFAPIDPEFSATLQTAAEAGWRYLEANPAGVLSVPGPYDDDDDSDDRFWAAATLYRLTGSDLYHNYLRDNYLDVATFFVTETDNAYGVTGMAMIAWLVYMHSDNLDAAMAAYFEDIFTSWSERMVKRWLDSPWKLAMLDEDFYWGSNYVTLTTPFVLIVGDAALGRRDPVDVVIAQQAVDYLLGANPLAFSYISGYGTNSLARPFSNLWSYDGIGAIPAGIMAGGPNAYSNPQFYSNFVGKRYFDSSGSWTINEHTIYWNAALVFNLALLADVASENGGVPELPEVSATTAVVSQNNQTIQATATLPPVANSEAGIELAVTRQPGPTEAEIAEMTAAVQPAGLLDSGRTTNFLLLALLLINGLILFLVLRWRRQQTP